MEHGEQAYLKEEKKQVIARYYGREGYSQLKDLISDRAGE